MLTAYLESFAVVYFGNDELVCNEELVMDFVAEFGGERKEGG